MSDFLLFLIYFQRSDVLFKFSLVDPMIIFSVLQLDLSLLFQLSELIQVLENQMLDTLFVYFDLDLIFLTQVLHLSLLIS